MTSDPDDAGPDVWTWLQAWYAAQCDGEWEHRYGVEIGTLDNPGWLLAADLHGTALEAATYARREVHRAEDDWCVTWVEDQRFRAACGPLNLAEAIGELRRWAEGPS